MLPEDMTKEQAYQFLKSRPKGEQESMCRAPEVASFKEACSRLKLEGELPEKPACTGSRASCTLRRVQNWGLCDACKKI